MAQRDIYLGKEIGNYRIERRIASGSYGTVYLARHLHLQERTVAIKILHDIHLGSDTEKTHFLQEAQILERLKGLPNILPLLDVGFDGNIPYMITEYAERGSLRTRMRQHNGPLPLQETLNIIEQVGKGLQSAHNKDVVHRDLKPANILFNAQGEALLADFGISTILLTASLHPTHVVGTPAYMAPEQFRGKICKESDQYALACIAYELLTGRKLFASSDLASIGFLHMTEAPTPPRQLNPQIPIHVENVLLKALSKQRTERYPSVSNFVTALTNPAPAVTSVDKRSKGSDPGPNINNDDREELPPVQKLSTVSKLPKTPREATGAIPPSVPHRNTSTYQSSSINPNTGKTPTRATRNTEATEALTHTGANTGKIPTRATRNSGATGTHPPLRKLSPASPTGPEIGGTINPRPTPPKRNKRIPIIIALVIVILLLVGEGAWAVLAQFPPAIITITPVSKTVQDTYIMQGVTGNANADNRQVTVRQLTSTKTDTQQVKLTPFHQDAPPATGSITFFSSSASPQTVTKATAIFSVGNVQVALDEDAVIPAATFGPPFQRGQKTVSAHAVQPGTAGNIAASAINIFPCCGSQDIAAQNQNAFTGGTDTVYFNSLKQADVNAVTNAAQNTLKSNAQNEITGQKKANEQFLGDIHCDDPKTTSDVTPGAHVNVTTANITVTVTCNVQAYDANAVQTIAQNALKQKASKDPGAGYVLLGNIVTQGQSPQVQPDGTITFSVLAKGVWSYQWTDANKQALLNKIKGMNKAQAQRTLNSYPGVGSATIDININNGGDILPTDASQIKLVANVVKGL